MPTLLICRLLRIAIFSLIFFVIREKALSTHIIGGEMIYRCLYYNPVTDQGFYEFTVKLYRDCTGNTAEYDSVIYVTIWNSTQTTVVKNFNITKPPTDTLDNNTYNICLFAPPGICVEEAIYKANFFLKPDKYYVTYQRCCRNDDIVNISFPLGTGAGWDLTMPDSSITKCNSSPYFKNYPPTIICLDERFDYDHSATDIDGDSLVYSLCSAINFNWNLYGFAPDPARPPKDLFPVSYISSPPYSAVYPIFAPVDSFKIDPQTGRLTGTPAQPGLYVVAVCVSEYRNGTLLSTNRRDFQFYVASCLDKVASDFTYLPDACNNEKVYFTSKSPYATFYYWDFGIDNMTDDTSIVKNPTYSYPDADTTFSVKLTVNKGYSCEHDTTYLIVLPQPLQADFYPKKTCINETTFFNDSSKINIYSGMINEWSWEFGDSESGQNNFSLLQNPTHIYNDLQIHNITLIVTTENGCKDTAYNAIDTWPPPTVYAGQDAYLSLGETIFLNASGAPGYVWSPGNTLSDSTVFDPEAKPLQTTSYVVTGTSQYGCKNRDTIIVNIFEPLVVVPNAFTPNGDGENDFIYPLTVGIRKLVEFRVFNRWGEIVFKTETLGEGWNGEFNSEPQEIGKYVYYFIAESLTGEIINGKGEIALLR